MAIETATLLYPSRYLMKLSDSTLSIPNAVTIRIELIASSEKLAHLA